ncbi:CNS1 [Candida oxycetoniae]|uniref:CNS1 n=1 Tax=Candida oxycetoniae TaxID=497107 RepID=A0AAI9WXW7_9ASCO|nr:CNS1 [Candida oxycetoniae]KAI3404663.2 CNS1 [Candida oxycetoniae]
MTEAPTSEWERLKYTPKPGEPELPPQIAQFSNKTTDEVFAELNRLPFFMTKLDETDGEGGENVGVEALKSLAYDGNPQEIATNFKNQGNDCYKAKQYKNAVEYYTKALEVDCTDLTIVKTLYLNRAACNLELKNYRRCIEDCKKVLSMDASSIKAIYRAGKALFLLANYEEAKLLLSYGLKVAENEQSLRNLLDQVETKEKEITKLKELEQKRKEEKQLQQVVLQNSLKLRQIEIVTTKNPLEMLKQATVRLEDPADYQSQLIFPALILYPTIDEFDYIAEISELSTPLEILEIILNRPKEWFDEKHKNFHVKTLDCFMETAAGGLVKVGKKIELNQALKKAPLFDNALKLYVVPKQDESSWVSKWNKETALNSRNS